jgi:hypothetical protein
MKEGDAVSRDAERKGKGTSAKRMEEVVDRRLKSV